MSHVTYFENTKLRQGETLIASMEGWIGQMMGARSGNPQHNGALVLTDQRVAFIRKGFFGEVFEAIPLDRITSVETRSILSYRVATFHTSNDDLSFKTFASAETFSTFVSEIENRYDRSNSEPQVSAVVGSVVSEIEKLMSLRAEGVLTEHEYALAKAQLLNGGVRQPAMQMQDQQPPVPYPESTLSEQGAEPADSPHLDSAALRQSPRIQDHQPMRHDERKKAEISEGRQQRAFGRRLNAV